MSRTARLSDRAESDLEELFLYYLIEGGDSPATRFLQAFEDTRILLAEYPEIGVLRSGLSRQLNDLRVLPVNPPFRRVLIFYRKTDEGAYVLRILHSARQLEGLFDDG